MRRMTVLVSLVALLVALMPLPASAQSIQLACPPHAVPPSGFTDVGPSNPHKAAIDCVAWYGIASGTSQTTFAPKQVVTRWQMALFLIRTIEDWQGFVDIAGLSFEAMTAVNKLKELSITAGTTPSTFTPDGTLTRWEMALFLSRLLYAQGLTLPDGADQGFTDIGHLDPSFQVAINQMKQLGITAGTAPNTYAPGALVTREQMASFLARTLQAGGDLPILMLASWSCDESQTNCSVNGTFPANTPFVIRPAWRSSPLPASPSFLTAAVRAEVSWNGGQVETTLKEITLNNVMFKYYEAAFQSGLSGNHTFVVTYHDDLYQSTITFTVVFTG